MSANDGTFTVNDVISEALKKSGVLGLGQSIGGEDVLDAQNDLSDMLAQWNVKTWLVFEKLDSAFVSDGRYGPPNSTAYTVGPAGNFPFNTRPDRVEAAYVRILTTSGQPVDQPIKQIPSRESYAQIALKELVAYPKSYFYDTASPLGNLYVYPWPSASLYEIHIITKNLYNYTTLPLTTDLSMLPGETRAALKFCLARRLRQAYGKGLRPDPELNALAKDAEATMRASHVQVPELVLPRAINRWSKYNIYGDQTY